MGQGDHMTRKTSIQPDRYEWIFICSNYGESLKNQPRMRERHRLVVGREYVIIEQRVDQDGEFYLEW